MPAGLYPSVFWRVWINYCGNCANCLSQFEGSGCDGVARALIGCVGVQAEVWDECDH